MENEKKLRRNITVLHVSNEDHTAMRYLSMKKDVPIIHLTSEALDLYFTQRIGPDWREKTAMDN